MYRDTVEHDAEAGDFHKDPDEPGGVQEVRPSGHLDILATNCTLPEIQHRHRKACFLGSDATPREYQKV